MINNVGAVLVHHFMPNVQSVSWSKTTEDPLEPVVLGYHADVLQMLLSSILQLYLKLRQLQEC